MASFKWSKSHSVYTPAFDSEHQELCALMEQLHNALSGGAEGSVQPALRKLLEQLGAHLSHEEREMRGSDYPGYEWHKRQHDTARKRVDQFASRVDGGDCHAASELLDFFKSWLKDHTGVHDRMMTAYLRNFDRAHAKAAS